MKYTVKFPTSKLFLQKIMDSPNHRSSSADGINFLNENSFLSNFYLSNIRYKGHTYRSAEHLFQAVRCADEIDREKIRNVMSPKSAKIIARFVKVRSGWEEHKVDVMRKILQMKFRRQSKLSKMLQKTANTPLTALNYWHDTFWGVCACTQHARTGQNMLGELLMEIRDKIE